MILNIRDALTLYELIGEFIPEDISKDTVFDFSGKIIHNIKNSDIPEVFGKCVMLLSGLSIEELSEMEISDVIRIFMEGLKENNILLLRDFCRSIKVSNAR